MIYAPPANLPMRKTNLSNPAKDNKYPEKTKWASIPHEAYFIAKRTKFRCSSKSIYSKAQLARTKCKQGYISLSTQIVKKRLCHF